MKKIKILLVPIFAVSLMTGVLITFAQEQVSITTYYPAPFGVYANLTVMDVLNISNVSTTGNQPGGPGISFAPPASGGNALEIASFDDGVTDHGLRIINYNDNLGGEVVKVGNVVGWVFSGLVVRGNGTSEFTNDLSVSGNFNAAHMFCDEPAQALDPIDLSGIYPDINWGLVGYTNSSF